ncbi:MAG: hypothetical protein LAT68_06990 [Cyclobacteriaceae bacterium]|nr:hypothetical protein [Cyclobacteriaceae bacterium]MCH8516059.1 hypothetical protein [Cyclobacteriaceae bacterium]
MSFASTPENDSKKKPTADPAVMLQLQDRLQEIQSMDYSEMTKEEKKELREELKEMKKEAKKSNGIYLSTGAIIIILLVLIIIT